MMPRRREFNGWIYNARDLSVSCSIREVSSLNGLLCEQLWHALDARVVRVFGTSVAFSEDSKEC